MENPRAEKVAVVDEVRERLSSADAALLTEYRGLNVSDISRLRQSVSAAGGNYKIYKNTLVRLAVREIGLEDLVPLLEGPTAIAFVDGDAASVAKALRDFARTNPSLVIKGGVLGTKVLSVGDATALADLPSREELLAKFAGLLQAPLQQFAGLLQAVPAKFAYGLQALIDQQGGAPEPAAEAESAGESEEAAAAPPEGETPAETEAPALQPEAAAETEAAPTEEAVDPASPVDGEEERPPEAGDEEARPNGASEASE